MPELPDVETYKRYLDASALHQPITRVDIAAPELLAGISSHDLEHALLHHRLESSRRHGKHLFVRIDNGQWLMLHFGMTGSLAYAEDNAGAPPYTRLRLDFDGGHHLAFVEPRKLGRIALTEDPGNFIESHHLGLDALSVDARRFRQLAAEHRGAIKPWLMNQQIVAGIGNIYADEILFQAGIHPQRNTRGLDESELTGLHASLRKVLEKAISAGADPARMPRSFLLPRREQGGKCPRCAGQIKTLSSGGRTTYFCPSCQPRKARAGRSRR